ncbi:MAG: outer membrane lipoprotein chaperone LolA [Thiomargarita sp.]|nr:outer membrane lipoprotein chaperone LolA [Thiomargarita sp.]
MIKFLTKSCFIIYLLPNILYANEVLNNFLSNLSSVQAQFTQEQYDEENNLLEKTMGNVHIQRPNRFRWYYQKPYEQLIIADGEKVWIYDTDLEQITVKKLNRALGRTPAFLLSNQHNNQIDQDFLVTQLATNNNIQLFQLIPKGEQAQFDSIEIGLNLGILQSLKLIDNLGQKTFIAFKNVKQNIQLKAELFIFTPPAGVDIIVDE